MSNDEYQRILLQVIRELKERGWSDEEIADCDIRIRETDDQDGLNGNPPARWDKYATEDTPTLVSDLMANTGLKYKIKGVFKG